MMSRTHAASAAVAYLALVPVARWAGLGVDPLTALVGACAAAGGAMLPDLDHPRATVSHALGIVTRRLAVGLRQLSGGHRQGTHSLIGVAFFTVLALVADVIGGVLLGVCLGFLCAIAVAAMWGKVARRLWLHTVICLLAGIALVAWSAVRVFPTGAITVAVLLGAVLHVAGDLLTTEGCPLLWPFSPRRFHVLGLRTHGAFERFVLVPLFSVGAVALFAGQALGPPGG